MWRTHISHSVADPYVKGDSVIHCVADQQVKEIKSVAQTVIGNRRTMLTEALCHIQFFNSCNPYTQESLARIEN